MIFAGNTVGLTQDRLRRLFLYDVGTGEFIRRVARGPTSVGSIAGRVTASGYVSIKVDYIEYYAHRLAWLYVKEEWPQGRIDHEDRNLVNNKFSNLRLATCSENAANTSARGHNTTGFKGVSRKRGRSRYIVQIGYKGSKLYVGTFDTAEEAAAVYDREAIRLFGPFACVNFGGHECVRR